MVPGYMSEFSWLHECICQVAQVSFPDCIGEFCLSAWVSFPDCISGFPGCMSAFAWFPTTLPHDQYVATLVLDGQEDLWHNNEDSPLGWRVDIPDAVHVGGIVTGVVRRLNVACIVPQLPTTYLI